MPCVRNPRKGPRGVRTAQGRLYWLMPGEAVELELAKGVKLYDGLVCDEDEMDEAHAEPEPDIRPVDPIEEQQAEEPGVDEPAAAEAVEPEAADEPAEADKPSPPRAHEDALGAMTVDELEARAAELGVTPRGTGKSGRVLKGDLVSAIAKVR